MTGRRRNDVPVDSAPAATPGRTPGRRAHVTHSPVASTTAWVMPLLAALLIGVFVAVGPASTAPTPAVPAPLDRVTYACPSSDLTVAAGQLAPGRSAEVTVHPDGSADELAQADRWRTDDPGATATIVTQQGAGTGAVGFVAGRLSEDDGDGLVVASCPEVVDTAWFVGAGSERDHTSELILSNTSDTVAVARVALWSEDGPVETIDADGIVVEPDSTREIVLRDLGASQAMLAIRVDRVRGAFTVGLRDRRVGERTGSTSLPITSTPRRSLDLGPFTDGRGRTLLVANPTEQIARITATALAGDGDFVPDGLDDLRVGPGTVASFPLPTDLGDGPVGLDLQSDVPVTASVLVAGNDADVAAVSAQSALTGAGIVPIDLDERRVPQILATSITDDDARLEIEAFDADMTSLGTTALSVPALSSAALRPGGDLDIDAAAYLVVRPRGRVIVSAAYVDGDQAAILPITAAPAGAPAPVVRPER